jgi:hypothetical protein
VPSRCVPRQMEQEMIHIRLEGRLANHSELLAGSCCVVPTKIVRPRASPGTYRRRTPRREALRLWSRHISSRDRDRCRACTSSWRKSGFTRIDPDRYGPTPPSYTPWERTVSLSWAFQVVPIATPLPSAARIAHNDQGGNGRITSRKNRELA